MSCQVSQNVFHFNSYVTSDGACDKIQFYLTFQYIWITVYMYSLTYMAMYA